MDGTEPGSPPTSQSLLRIGRWAGVGSVVVVFASIVSAIALSPSFALEANALSDLGSRTHPAGTLATALAFNGGLIVGGALGLGFAAVLARTADRSLVRLGAALFGVTSTLLAAIGAFPQGHPLHFPVASGFYALFSVSVLVFGAGKLTPGRWDSALVSVGAGIGNLAVWIVWIGLGALDRPGLAIPEIVGALFVVLWVLDHARRLSSAGRQTQADHDDH
ncbi:MAG: DUF998 domain-containing protein [Halapricum sp.]